MNEIVRRPEPTLAEKMQWAQAMATASALPRQYRNSPGDLLFALEYADSLGVSRIAAITSIHVIEGKPSASADLIASMVRRSGHKLRVVGDDTYAEATLIRADDPEFPFVVRWDMKRAAQAGLTGKPVWKNYPAAMLRARAITEVARMGASDSLAGMQYTPEELGANVNADGDVVEGHVVENVTAPEPKPTDPTLIPITDSTRGRLFALLGEIGISDDDDQRQFLTDTLGREVESRSTLTEAEGVTAGKRARAIQKGDPAAEWTPTFDAEVVEETQAEPEIPDPRDGNDPWANPEATE